MAMNIFTELSLIIVVAAAVAALMRILKQPLIVGHIITGLLVGPFLFDILKSVETIEALSQIGIAFLLFVVGLSLSPRVFREVGYVSLITGVGQVVFTAIAGFYLASRLGFETLPAVYVALALTFSSTIIIMKLLSDKGDLNKLYGKISVGFLLVQDLIVVLLLVAVPLISSGENVLDKAGVIFLKGVLLALFLYLVSLNILPRLEKFFARSQEFLFLFAIAWGLGLAMLFHYIGFSIEIGALIAGVVLSASPYHFEIGSKMRPLRDFFIILFFIFLGAQMSVANIGLLIVPALALSAFVLIGNPIIVMVLMGMLGFGRRVGFFAGLTVAQISEFSLILTALGVRLGHLNPEILSLITLVGFITIGVSAYMILHAERLYAFLAPHLLIFEKRSFKKREKKEIKKEYQAILFGYNRVGYDFVEAFRRLGAKFLVVDFNPEVENGLKKDGVNFEYGDADDGDFLDLLELNKIKFSVSTIPDFETNLFVISKIREVNKKAIIMVISHSIEDAEALYKAGATYIVLPHFLGGKYAASMVENLKFDFGAFKKEKQKHIKYLKERKKLRHEHPKHE